MENGRFYFKLTKTGNLIGEFFNDDGNGTESSDRQKGDKQEYEGAYITTWQEKNKARIADLKIIKMLEEYKLEWIEGSDGTTFTGSGRVGVDGTLFGTYNYIGRK